MWMMSWFKKLMSLNTRKNTRNKRRDNNISKKSRTKTRAR